MNPTHERSILLVNSTQVSQSLRFFFLAMEQSSNTHSIHGTGIFTFTFYHKNSTIHVGKFTIVPWIHHGIWFDQWKNELKGSEVLNFNSFLCPIPSG